MSNQYMNAIDFRSFNEFNKNDTVLRFGEYNIANTRELYPHIDRKIEIVIKHPQWHWNESENMAYDVALIKLSEQIEYSLHILPICLSQEENLLIGENAWIKGFGSQNSYGNTLSF